MKLDGKIKLTTYIYCKQVCQRIFFLKIYNYSIYEVFKSPLFKVDNMLIIDRYTK